MPINVQEVSEDELKTLDAILIVDHSGSMGGDSLRLKGRTRLQEVEEDAVAIARIAGKYDDDGLTVIAFSSHVRVFDGVTADRVAAVFKEFPPRGSTDLAGALQAGIDKAASSKKQAVLLVYTDGAPDDAGAVVDVVRKAANTYGRPKLGICIMQVGDGADASKFLDDLDNHMKGCPDIFPPSCEQDPRSTAGQPIVMYHCPDCGAMLLAGASHPEVCVRCRDRKHPGFDVCQVCYPHPVHAPGACAGGCGCQYDGRTQGGS